MRTRERLRNRALTPTPLTWLEIPAHNRSALFTDSSLLISADEASIQLNQDCGTSCARYLDYSAQGSLNMILMSLIKWLLAILYASLQVSRYALTKPQRAHDPQAEIMPKA